MDKIVCSGALFYTISTQRFLLMYRKNGKRSNQWGIVGGTNEGVESPWEGLQREISEEIGFIPETKKIIPLETFISNNGKFEFHTYVCIIDNEFMPQLNDEHNGYAWVSFDNWPKPLHQGLRNTLSSRINRGKLETIFDIFKM
jgi:8-oxo-dGTP pyrophosphatase MutT (NUDIX family)